MIEKCINESKEVDVPAVRNETIIDNETNNDGYCEWVKIKGNTYVPSLKNIIEKQIQPGVYDLSYDHRFEEVVLVKRKVILDELLYLPDPIFDTIINDIEYFWDNEEKFKKYDFTYKRGILLHGKPGCGKSSICLLLSQQIINKGGVVIYINDGDDLSMFNTIIKQFRMIESNTPILCILEDLDGLLRMNENETKLLNLLDGVNQINNVVYIGNTNYPENLKDRIINRPSRFDRRYEIAEPNEKIRRFYLEKKIMDEDKEKIDIEYIVNNSEGLSLAHLSEIVKSICIFGKDIEESIKEIKDMNDKFISSSQYDKKGGVGFNRK